MRRDLCARGGRVVALEEAGDEPGADELDACKRNVAAPAGVAKTPERGAVKTRGNQPVLGAMTPDDFDEASDELGRFGLEVDVEAYLWGARRGFGRVSECGALFRRRVARPGRPRTRRRRPSFAPPKALPLRAARWTPKRAPSGSWHATTAPSAVRCTSVSSASAPSSSARRNEAMVFSGLSSEAPRWA